jgi:hypothetical protein
MSSTSLPARRPADSQDAAKSNWHPDPLPATKKGGLAGRVFTIKAYKNRGFCFLDPPPRHLAKGSEGRSTRDKRIFRNFARFALPARGRRKLPTIPPCPIFSTPWARHSSPRCAV